MKLLLKISVDFIISVYAKKIGTDNTFILGEEKFFSKYDINKLKKLIEEKKKEKNKMKFLKENYYIYVQKNITKMKKIQKLIIFING